MAFRIGIGYDMHAFAPVSAARPLVIGGVHFPDTPGLAGHSDADVLTHAVADALLGAARLGDLGEHFPDSDPRYLQADSLELLRQVTQKVAEAGFQIVDVDCVVLAEQPKLSPHRVKMQENLAAAMLITTEAVGVKATTTEGLGAIGRREGIAATAVALLESTIIDSGNTDQAGFSTYNPSFLTNKV
ncbi:MAG: 2-C-methyl-D-erythritol 2,4-cyclodiphosphate synthase [Coriobacteriales bacterium]|jgi:2-C-methyl-D-erythritol 2,4-cyclodiphosphate synthase|nr:2-C-methyl-D-erythritol 2,4-cyclodiphosphate synthase [Coriobacteriales bacterium]